jgi:HlyD family secretion protein
VKVRFDQARSAGLASGLPASIALRSNPSRPVPGQVARLEAIGDSVTEERLAQVAFGRAPEGVTIGELAEVTVALPSAPAAVVVPNASVRQRADQTGVWIAEGGALRFAPVQLGPSGLDGRVVVLAGLEPGQQVVLYSERELAAGIRIKVVDTIAGRRP